MTVSAKNEVVPTPVEREREQGFLFVTGCKRSATEFLNHRFDGHPRLVNVVVEFYAFEYLARNMDLAPAIVEFAETAPVEEVYDSFFRRGFLPCFDRRNVKPGAWPDPELDDAYFELDFDKAEFFDRFRQARSGGLGSPTALIRAWFACLKQTHPFSKQPNARWLLKCADFGLTARAADYLGLLDNAAFCVRHPVAILNSIKRLRMKEQHRDFHIFQLLEVCRAMENVPEVVQTLQGRVRLIRYEDLVQAPGRVLHDLADSWGIGFDRALDEATVMGQPWESNSSFGESRNQTMVLTDDERRAVLSHTTDFRRTFGYLD